MIANPDRFLMSPEAYLVWEEQQLLKHEYLDGEVHAMTGGTLPHNDIALNLYSVLRPHLQAKGCRINVADVKVEVSNTAYFYPDLVVSCDDRDRQALKLIRYPTLIIEVLSPSTAGFDRGDKFKSYRRLKTLQEYVLVDAEKMGVEGYRRNDRGKWELTAYPADEAFLADQPDCPVQFTSLDSSALCR